MLNKSLPRLKMKHASSAMHSTLRNRLVKAGLSVLSVKDGPTNFAVRQRKRMTLLSVICVG